MEEIVKLDSIFLTIYQNYKSGMTLLKCKKLEINATFPLTLFYVSRSDVDTEKVQVLGSPDV